jgi:hypothetical protein
LALIAHAWRQGVRHDNLRLSIDSGLSVITLDEAILGF